MRIARAEATGAMRRAMALLVAVLGLVGIAAPTRAAPNAPVVLAAASLQEGLSAAAEAWTRHGHPRPVLSFAGTPALARQIEAGAPADLFFSADEDWMTYLAQRRLLRPGSRVAVLTNQIVLIAPAASAMRLNLRPGFPLARALGSGRLAMADPASVPAGKYGREALQALGVWAAVAPRVAGVENVRAALALVGRGEAPLGVVFATDARASSAVRVVGVFPASSHAPISYPLATLARSQNPEAEGFRRFLIGPEARAIFRRYGFGTR